MFAQSAHGAGRNSHPGAARAHTARIQLRHSRIGRLCAPAALGNDGARASDGPESPPLSLFVPYKALPPNGQLNFKAEQECDVQVSNCKTMTYTYESQCESCSGTGLARGLSSSRRRRGGRGSLHSCLVCTGMGHVRRTTSRYMPDIKGDIEHATLARQQRLPGEPTQQLAAPGHSDAHANKWSRLRKAKEMFVKMVQPGQGSQQAGDAQSASAGAANGTGTSTPPSSSVPVPQDPEAPEPVAALSSNIVSSNGRLAARPPSSSQGAADQQQQREPVGKA